MKRVLQLGALTLALIGAGGAQAIPLSELLAGGSITAGDKVFDQFSTVSFVSNIAGRSLNAANIDVTALADGGLSPGPGLKFSVANDELTVTGGNGYTFLDFAFGFRVTAAPGFKIKGNLLDIDSGSLSSSGGDAEDLGIVIQEWVGAGIADPADPDYIAAELSRLAGSETSVLSASSAFASKQDIWVTKDILVWADGTDEASLGAFSQRFSQLVPNNVPEPGMLTLVAVAVLGALGASRRRTGSC